MPEEISKWAGSLSMFRIWSHASYSLNSFKRGYIGGYTFFHTTLHIGHSLNSLKGGYTEDYIGTTMGVVEGDTGSLDYSSCNIGRMDKKMQTTLTQGLKRWDAGRWGNGSKPQ